MNSINGGKAIGHGGFGCVFRPSLKCTSNSPSNNEISKLMLKEDAEEEYNEIQFFASILSKIKNYKNYYLIDNIRICEPTNVSQSDLKLFNKQCTSLIKEGFTPENINYKLNDLAMLVMPYGGVSIEQYINNNISSISLTELNKSMIDLFKNGIIPMNKKNIYHADLKSSNILCRKDQNKELRCRLIDWGLSVIANKNEIPNNLYRRPFQFNVPFSNVIFTDTFIEMYQIFLNHNPRPSTFQYREFTINYIYTWIQERGLGHFKAINKQMYRLYEKEIIVEDKTDILKYDFTYYHIIEYISSILESFTKEGSFYYDKYYKNVFLKNLDVWGFACSYYPLFNILYKNYDKLNENDLNLFFALKYLFIHFLYETSTTAISHDKLIDYLNDLSNLISKSLIINSKNIRISLSS